MGDHFIFDLDNKEQFPFLNGIGRYLAGFIPREELMPYEQKQYNPEQYNGIPNKEVETIEQTAKDIKRGIGLIKGALLELQASDTTFTYINNLIEEREKFAINITTQDQRDYCNSAYNKRVIARIDKYWISILQRLEAIFYPRFGDFYKGDLNPNSCFQFWYKKFEITYGTLSLLQSQPPETKREQRQQNEYTAKEYALAYIFDLYTNGKQVPANRIEGGYNAKEIKKIGEEKGFKKPDTFYRAVKAVLEYDLNRKIDLVNISNDWLNAVQSLSNNWMETEKYLKSKNLL